MRKAPWNKGLTKETDKRIAKVAFQKSKWWKDTDTTKTREKIGLATRNRDNPKGEKHWNWKGGRLNSRGYIYVYKPNHPGANYKGYIFEHRLIMGKLVGRNLFPDEDVNHINGIKDDNRIENLRLVRHNKHYEERKCPKCNFTWNTR